MSLSETLKICTHPPCRLAIGDPRAYGGVSCCVHGMFLFFFHVYSIVSIVDFMFIGCLNHLHYDKSALGTKKIQAFSGLTRGCLILSTCWRPTLLVSNLARCPMLPRSRLGGIPNKSFGGFGVSQTHVKSWYFIHFYSVFMIELMTRGVDLESRSMMIFTDSADIASRCLKMSRTWPILMENMLRNMCKWMLAHRNRRLLDVGALHQKHVPWKCRALWSLDVNNKGWRAFSLELSGGALWMMK